MLAEVRPARADELGSLAGVLRTAGLGTSVGRLLEFPRASPGGEVLVAESAGRIVGGAAVAGFGASGWIGALGVLPAHRGRGTGTALTDASVAWLRDRGVETVLLYATEAGLPVYQDVGFVAEGAAHAWRDVAAPPRSDRPPGVRPLRGSDREAVLALDAAATGEDRGSVLGSLDLDERGAGLVVERDGRVTGSAVRSSWGLGPSIVAADADAGLALLSALRREAVPALTISLPDANETALRALHAWGLRPINHATRMRLGPPPRYVPERLFGLYNLFWG